MTIASITTRVCSNELQSFEDFFPDYVSNLPRPRAFPKYYYKTP